MALEGTLKDFSLADIFQLIGLQRKTGVLTLRAPEDVVSISFLDGKVVGADSLNKRIEDRLGQVLLKTGAVTQDDLDRALKVQMETLERLGHILMRHRVISREGLHEALEQQILQIIYRVFRWQDGDYHFSQETSIDYDAELVSPMSAESILMEGARMLDEWPIIEKRIPRRDMVFVPLADPATLEIASQNEMDELDGFDFDLEVELERTPPPKPTSKLRVSRLEADVLALLDGRTTVEDVIRLSPANEFETYKALYTLLNRQLIREASRAELSLASQAPAERRPAAQAASSPRVPWLALVFVPLLALSFFIAPRNPLNPVLGRAPSLAPRIASAYSWARMWGIWQTVQARGTLVGSYPETLTEVQREGMLTTDSLSDPWGRPYRYILREQSLLLAGSAPNGNPDPSLILSRQLWVEEGDQDGRPGAVLEH